MSKVFSIFTIIEFLTFIIAIICLLKDKSLFWKLAIAYMLVTFSTEFTAVIIGRILHQHNVWLYNIYIIFENCFVSFGLYQFLKQYVNPKPLILVGSGLIFLSYCYEVFSHGFTEVFYSATNNLSAAIYVLYSLYYFYVLLKDDNFIKLKYHPQFWWVVGVLFYYFGGTIINLFDDVFRVKLSTGHWLRWYIYIILNLLLYSFWSYSFICRARQRRLQP